MTRGVGIHNQDSSAPVALAQWKDDGRAVAEALDLCNALKDFDPAMRVLIKPNLVEYLPNVKYSPFGIITTSVVLEALVQYLRDAGAKDITIAESGLEITELDCSTNQTYQKLGYHYLTKRYGVKLMDLGQEEFRKIGLGGFSLNMSVPVLDHADFLVNLPALKTHEQTKVTLGFKNNKGCLSKRSKCLCHHVKRNIDEFVARIGERLYPHLTLIDGIYSLANGPMHMGKAYRENLIIASRDMFSADCLGAFLLGYEPAEIDHLTLFSQQHGRSLRVADIEVKGLRPEDHVHSLPYIDLDDPWYSGADVTPKFFQAHGIKGWRQPHPGQTCCTGCALLFPFSVLFAITANVLAKGQPYDEYELLGGKTTKPSGHANKTFLLGDCSVAFNRKGEGIKEAIPLPGCPPSIEQMISTFNHHGIKFDGEKTMQNYFNSKAGGYEKKGDLYKMEHFKFPLV